MAVMRVHNTTNYTAMSNTHIREKSMSLQAIGLLSLMLSLPDDWDYSISGLCAIRKEKETAIKNTLRELRHFGYLTITKIRNAETGKFEYIYDIYEKPQTGSPGVGLPAVDEPAVGEPAVDEPAVGEPAVVNHGQISTKVLNTNKLNTNKQITENTGISVTPGLSGTERSPGPSRKYDFAAVHEGRFARFWNAYPRKVSKEAARRAWAKISPDDALCEKILSAVRTAKERDYRFREERYTPHPATWLNSAEWENQYSETPDMGMTGDNVFLRMLEAESEAERR